MAISMLYGAQNLKLVNGIVAVAPKGLGSGGKNYPYGGFSHKGLVSYGCRSPPPWLDYGLLCDRCEALKWGFPSSAWSKGGGRKEACESLGVSFRLILGATAGAYYVLVPIYMWIKDQALPKGQPI